MNIIVWLEFELTSRLKSSMLAITAQDSPLLECFLIIFIQKQKKKNRQNLQMIVEGKIQ